VTQPPAIIKNQVGIDTAVNISIAAQDIKPMAIIMAIHCLTQALESFILYQGAQGIRDGLVGLFIMSG